MEVMVGLAVGVIGLSSILLKKSLMGVLSGVFLVFLGVALTILWSGFTADALQSAHAVGVVIILSGIIYPVVGAAAAIRAFYLKGDALLGKKQ